MRIWFAVSACLLIIVPVLAPSILFGEEYTLDDLYRIALQRAEKIKVQEENVTNARLDINKARGALIPNLSAYGTYTQFPESKEDPPGKYIQSYHTSNWGLLLTQSYSLGGKEFTALDVAGITLEKSNYDLIAFKQDFLLTTSLIFYDLLRAKKTLEIANANLERLTKYRDAVETKLRVGELTKRDLLRAQGELSGALSDKTKAVNTVDSVKAFLARNVGIVEPFDIKETPEADTVTATLADLQKQAMDHRVELKSLDTQKMIAERQVAIAKSANKPNLSLGATYARVDQYPPTSSSLNREAMSANMALNFLLADGGERKSDIMQAETRLRQAELLYRDGVNSILLEVKNAYLDYNTQQGIVQFLIDQLVYAQDNINAVTRQYEFGLANSLDMIDANNLLLSSQRDLVNATYNSRFTLLRVKRVTGMMLSGAGNNN